VNQYANISSTVASLYNSAILSKNIADMVMLGTADNLPFKGLQVVLWVFEGISLGLVVVVAVMLILKIFQYLETTITSTSRLADTADNEKAKRLNSHVLFIVLALLILNIAIDCIRATIFGVRIISSILTDHYLGYIFFFFCFFGLNQFIKKYHQNSKIFIFCRSF
jgi:hypothetical protein